VEVSGQPMPRVALLMAAILAFFGLIAAGQNSLNRQQGARNSSSAVQAGEEPPSAQAEQELQKGTDLTKQGLFAQAIPHLLAAQGRVGNDYAAAFNLALCYVATGQPEKAIPVLAQLRAQGHDNADVNNLLTQAYIGEGHDEDALKALRRAAAMAPASEKLYMFVADACMSRQNYTFGLKAVDLGLDYLPNSAWLHYERGMFLALMDEFDEGRKDFRLAAKLAPETTPGLVAAAQESMMEGDLSNAIRVAREGINQKQENFILLTLLGRALLQSGAAPGQPEFAEAKQALEESIAERPGYAQSQLTLGKLYLLENRLAEAIEHLEMARQLNPADPAVYSTLAVAYRRQGDLQKAQSVLAVLAKINQEQAEKIRSAPGDRKLSYGQAGALK